MDPTLGPTGLLVAALAGALALVAVVLLGVMLRGARRDRARAEAQAAAARAETARLERRLGELADRLDAVAAPRPTRDRADEAAYLITDAGREPAPMVEDRLVLSAAVGEPLVKAVAFGHGVRRALSAESRSRIRLAVRQETRKARKQRRREMRDLWVAHKRAARAEGAAAERARAASAA